jgi:hypothetical protein
MSDELDVLMAAAAEAGEDIGDEELDIDLSEAVDISPFAAKGVNIEVVKAVAKLSSAGNKYIKMQIRVFEGDFEKRVIFDNVNLKGAGAGFGRQTLDALGAGIDWAAPKVKASKLIGLKATVDCVIESQEGYNDKTVVKNWRPYKSADTAAAAEVK